MKKLTSILVVMALVFVFTVTGSAVLIQIGTAQFDAGGLDGPIYPLLWDDDASVVWFDYTAAPANQQTQITWAAGLNTNNPLNLTLYTGVTVTFEGVWRLANTSVEVTVGQRTLGGVGFSNLIYDRYWGMNYWEPYTGYFAGEIYNPLTANGYNEYQNNALDEYGLALRSATVEIAILHPADLDSDLDGDGVDLAKLALFLSEGSVSVEEFEAFASAFGRVDYPS